MLLGIMCHVHNNISEMFTFLTDPKTSIVFASGSTTVSAAIQLKKNVSCYSFDHVWQCILLG